MKSIIIIEIEHGEDSERALAEAFFNFGVGPEDELGVPYPSVDGEDYRVVAYDVIKNTAGLEPVANRGF